MDGHVFIANGRLVALDHFIKVKQNSIVAALTPIWHEQAAVSAHHEAQ